MNDEWSDFKNGLYVESSKSTFYFYFLMFFPYLFHPTKTHKEIIQE